MIKNIKIRFMYNIYIYTICNIYCYVTNITITNEDIS